MVKQEIPKGLRKCRDVEVPSASAMKTQRDVAAFLPSLAAGYVDCKDKLDSVVKLVDGP